jgi:SAM-dependent MidA family methyltransferase
MTSQTAQWPHPDPAGLASSAALTARIAERIEAAGGWIPFSKFMQMALYEPGFGYYLGGSHKFGADGDFVTAPELGSFLAQAIIATITPSLRELESPTLVELGAGTGALAFDILARLGETNLKHLTYAILEPSPELRARQRTKLAQFGGRVTWLDSLEPASIEGVIIANEVADALPVERFAKRDGRWFIQGVACDAGQFVWRERPCEAAEVEALDALEQQLGAPLPDGYESEYCALLAPWVKTIADALCRGLALLIDYGLPAREYYHPQRNRGTLICHYRHRAHDDPFMFPGLQDITAWVNFSGLAAGASAAGMTVAGYTTQGGWLTESLWQRDAQLTNIAVEQLAKLKTLVLPGEMGERFKVMCLSKGLPAPSLAGRDMRKWL